MKIVSSCMEACLRFFPLQSYEKVLLKIACSGNDYRGAYYGNRRFAGVFRFATIFVAFLRKAMMGFFVIRFFRYYSIKQTKYKSGIKVRTSVIAPIRRR